MLSEVKKILFGNPSDYDTNQSRRQTDGNLGLAQAAYWRDWKGAGNDFELEIDPQPAFEI